jgi:hypothetical protein
MRNIPPEVYASWPAPNYTNPQTRGPSVVIFNAVLISIVTFTVLLRLYVRAYMLRWLGIDDVFIIIALVSLPELFITLPVDANIRKISTMGLTACVLIAYLAYGWDRHVWDIPFPKLARMLPTRICR